MTEVPADYAEQEVREYDRDRYLTALFAPASRRPGLFALYAFNLEIAKTREVVREPMIGQMRLQWWRDTVDALYAGRTIAHAVAAPLGEAIRGGALDQALFHRLIDGREADLTGEAPPDLDALDRYAAETGAPLVALAAQQVGGWAPATAEAALLVGRAYALAGLLRAVPFHARQNRLYLPIALLAESGLRPRDVFERGAHPALAAVVEPIAERARALLLDARRIQGIPRTATPALLVATIAERALNRLRRARYDVFDAGVQAAGGAGRAVSLMLAAATGRW